MKRRIKMRREERGREGRRREKKRGKGRVGKGWKQGKGKGEESRQMNYLAETKS